MLHANRHSTALHFAEKGNEQRSATTKYNDVSKTFLLHMGVDSARFHVLLFSYIVTKRAYWISIGPLIQVVGNRLLVGLQRIAG